MKAKYVLLAIFLSLSLSGAAMACGGGGGCGGSTCESFDACGNYTGCEDNCGTSEWGNEYGYSRTSRACDCDCVDEGWRYNDCISRCTYCEAFGNVGAR